MNIENYIKMLLSDQETIVVPDLGAFVISTEESLYGEVMKKVTFDSNNTQNDGLLAGMIARYESITEEEAMLKIENFVAIVLREVSQNKLCLIEGFGKFYYDWKDSLGFDLEPEILETLQGSVAQPEEVTETENAVENAEAEVKEAKKGSPMKLIMAISVPIVIIGGIVALVLTKKVDPSKITHMMDKEEATEEEMASDSTATEGEATMEESTATAEETTSSETTATETTTATTTTKPTKSSTSSSSSNMSVAMGEAESVQKGRYYVIAGGFSSQENAQKMASKVGGAKVLAPTGNNLYRVSLFDTDNLDEANKKVTELNSGYNNSLWVLK